MKPGFAGLIGKKPKVLIKEADKGEETPEQKAKARAERRAAKPTYAEWLEAQEREE